MKNRVIQGSGAAGVMGLVFFFAGKLEAIEGLTPEMQFYGYLGLGIFSMLLATFLFLRKPPEN